MRSEKVMRYGIVILAVLLLVALGVMAIRPLVVATPIREVRITEVLYKTQVVEVYVDRPVEVVTTIWVPYQTVIEKEVYVPYQLSLKHWESVEELEAWLAEDNTDAHLKSYPGDDCDDQAYRLQAAAAEDGYFLSVEYDDYDTRYRAAHMVNSAKVGNSLYFIEASDDTVWFFVNLD